MNQPFISETAQHFKASIDKVPLKSVDSKPVLPSIVNFES
jgi:hypothetical protein